MLPSLVVNSCFLEKNLQVVLIIIYVSLSLTNTHTKGLADAFPMVKVFLGAIFAAFFVICRVFMWSTVSYYYCRDAWNVLSGSDPRMKRHKMWFRFTFLSLSILSLLQIIWLAEIARVGKEELEKVGLL